jgi:P-type Na+/K+ transporter
LLTLIRISLSKNKEGRWTSTGDPTEVALQVFAHKLHLARTSLTDSGSSEQEQQMETANTLLDAEKEKSEDISDKADEAAKRAKASSKRFWLKTEFPFDSSLKRMSMIYLDRETPGEALGLLKGAVSFLQPSIRIA